MARWHRWPKRDKNYFLGGRRAGLLWRAASETGGCCTARPWTSRGCIRFFFFSVSTALFGCVFVAWNGSGPGSQRAHDLVRRGQRGRKKHVRWPAGSFLSAEEPPPVWALCPLLGPPAAQFAGPEIADARPGPDHPGRGGGNLWRHDAASGGRLGHFSSFWAGGSQSHLLCASLSRRRSLPSLYISCIALTNTQKAPHTPHHLDSRSTSPPRDSHSAPPHTTPLRL